MNVNIVGDPRVPYVGHTGLQEFNNNGIMMIYFTVTRNLIVSIMMFPHKSVHKKTSISLDGQTRNKINYVMTDTTHARNINGIQRCRL